jgi:hypothetical protein
MTWINALGLICCTYGVQKREPTMVTFVRTNVALPGKLFELLAVAKEIAAVVKGLTGTDLAVCSAFGGNPTEVASIWQVDRSPNSKPMLSK